MIINLTPVVVLALLAWVCRVLARRAWDAMPLEKTPSPWSRSQRQNRRAAERWHDNHPRLSQARFERRRAVRFLK